MVLLLHGPLASHPAARGFMYTMMPSHGRMMTKNTQNVVAPPPRF
ncbi:MAG: hypothetical protein WCF04_11395 [Candidatus Nanopelagicales bacterium]